MTSAGDLALSCPAYSLGSLVPVEQAVGPASPPRLVDRLRSQGFAHCSVSDRPPSAMATDAITDLLDRTGMAAGDVDAVVYGTCSHGDRPVDDAEGGIRERLLRPLGMQRARLVGVWLGESGTLANALRMARALLVASPYRTVLVVLADAVPGGPGEYRAMPNAVAINGDGAAACVVSTHIPGAFRLDGVGYRASPPMTAPGRGRGLREYLEFLAGVRQAVQHLYASSRTTAEDYRWMVTNNYGWANLEDFADVAGIPTDRVFRRNVHRFGHVFAADGLINLADLTRSDDLRPGEKVLVLSSGPFSWGALSMTRSDHTL